MGQDLSNALAAAARGRLAPLGLQRKGRSRSWFDDHGWWLIHVEFQPSWSRRFYVNVGADHLFVYRDHVAFEDFERPLGGTWVGDGSPAAINLAMNAAAEAVVKRRVRHGDGRSALKRLAASSDDLVGGIAAALLGNARRARKRLTGHVHEAYRPIADAYLESLARDDVQAVARSMTKDTRAALRLAPTDSFWTP